MIKRFLSGCIFLFFLTGDALYAQTQSIPLSEIFELADRNNHRLLLQKLAVSEAEQAVKVAQDKRLPDIQGHVELKYIGDGVMTDRDFGNAEYADMPNFGNSFVLKASQRIYTGGAITRTIEHSRLKQQEAELTYEKDRQDVRFLLAGYYLDLYQLNNQKRVYERNIEQTNLLVKDIRAAYRQGTALKSDITRYELQLQNLELALTSVKNQMNILSHKLASAVGLQTETVILPDSAELLQVPLEKRSEQEWMDEMNRTPSVRLAALKIRQEENRLQLVRAERRPTVSLTAVGDLAGPILIEVPPMNNNFTYWYAGVGISYNLDALFKSGKKLKQTRLAIGKMNEAHRLVVEEKENDIHAAYVSLNEAYVRLETQKKSVQLAHENYNIVRQRYMNGLSLITDMLDASNIQLDMELQLANYQINILYQHFLLKKLTGML